MSGTVGIVETILLLASGNELPLWGKWISAFAPPIAILLTGLFTGVVTYYQHQDQKKAFHNQQYERKLRVFHGFKELFAYIIREGVLNENALHQFSADTMEAEFLFDQEVVSLRKELYNQGIQFIQVCEKLYAERVEGLVEPSNEDRSGEALKKKEFLEWFLQKRQETETLFKERIELKT